VASDAGNLCVRDVAYAVAQENLFPDPSLATVAAWRASSSSKVTLTRGSKVTPMATKYR